MFNDLLEPDYGVDDSPPDATDINQFILYFSDKEFPEFKQLLKDAMKREYPTSFQTANSSDTLLTILRKYNANFTT